MNSLKSLNYIFLCAFIILIALNISAKSTKFDAYVSYFDRSGLNTDTAFSQPLWGEEYVTFIGDTGLLNNPELNGDDSLELGITVKGNKLPFFWIEPGELSWCPVSTYIFYLSKTGNENNYLTYKGTARCSGNSLVGVIDNITDYVIEDPEGNTIAEGHGEDFDDAEIGPVEFNDKQSAFVPVKVTYIHDTHGSNSLDISKVDVSVAFLNKLVANNAANNILTKVIKPNTACFADKGCAGTDPEDKEQMKVICDKKSYADEDAEGICKLIAPPSCDSDDDCKSLMGGAVAKYGTASICVSGKCFCTSDTSCGYGFRSKCNILKKRASDSKAYGNCTYDAFGVENKRCDSDSASKIWIIGLGCTTKCSKDADCEKEKGKPDCIGYHNEQKNVAASLLSIPKFGGCSTKLASDVRGCYSNDDCESNFCKNLYYSKFNGVYVSDMDYGVCADSRGSAEDLCLADNDCEKGLICYGPSWKKGKFVVPIHEIEDKNIPTGICTAKKAIGEYCYFGGECESGNCNATLNKSITSVMGKCIPARDGKYEADVTNIVNALKAQVEQKKGCKVKPCTKNDYDLLGDIIADTKSLEVLFKGALKVYKTEGSDPGFEIMPYDFAKSTLIKLSTGAYALKITNLEQGKYNLEIDFLDPVDFDSFKLANGIEVK